ncbi:inversin isoform X1 [Pantherophis guttatus]|uniref:Inversin isoform X1 n=1 Tax=Pantherophis guttatus TaxID=94885 RepID=A0ABM3ZHB5_PANGU|nr:inversin isoform X1 [Pantherophis guttatus]
MNDSETWLFNGSSLASQVHAAAVNGHKRALLKQISGNPDLKDKEDQFGRTPLMYCILADRLDCAEVLLKTGTDVDKADHSQRTALHLAAQKGNYRFMKLLLAHRANWMKKDLEEIIPLHLTTQHKSPKCLALLLKYMAPGEVDTQDKNKQTALHWSAYYNNPEHVKILIKHDSNIGIPDIEGRIPLHWAANHKDPSAVNTVKCILDAAPTESLLNWQDYEGRTPLHFAVADGNIAVVDLLTSYESCNVSSYDNLFRTPLHWAALLGHAQIVHVLLERNKVGTILSDSQGATPLHYAAQSNFSETVEEFFKHPSVRDDSDLEGRTSFMWAAGKGSDEVIQTMLKLKLVTDINVADKYGGTALHAAALSGHVSTVQLLLKHYAQVDSADVMKHTPLFRACEMGHKEVIQTLIKGGARVDLVDQDGHSPLHWAALGGNPDVCQILIENKINPNVQDYAGRTPLQCAAYGGYINCMVVLLENNADPNIQDKEGRTALHWLCNNGYLDAIKLLLGFGAFPNHMENNEERYTPLDFALLGGHHEVIQFMLEHGALSIAAIQDIAAVKIQAVYKGYKVRKAFQDRKNLLMKHDQLRKDAAAKKREEENRRKASEQQKEMHNCKTTRINIQQQNFSEMERNHLRLHTSQCSVPPVKRPPSGNMSQNQPGKGKRSTVLSSKVTNKNKNHSVELLGEDHKRKMGVCEANSNSKPAYILSYSCKNNDQRRHQTEKKHQTVSASLGRDGKPPTTTTGMFVHISNKRHNSNTKSPNSGEELDHPNCSVRNNINHSEETTVFIQDDKCLSRSSRSIRNSGQYNAAFKNNPHQLKTKSKESNNKKWSLISSSRPGSATVRTMKVEKATSNATATQINKMKNNDICLVAKNASFATIALNKMARSDASLNREALLTSTNSEDQHGFVQHKNAYTESVPSAIQMQVIEKERVRKELFQRKYNAANVIQKVWRSYQLRKQFLQLFSTKQQCKDEWQQKTTVLCIKAIWNKKLNFTVPKALTSGKIPKAMNKNSLVQKSTTLKQIYGHSQEGKVNHPMRLPSSKQQFCELQLISGHLDSISFHYFCLFDGKLGIFLQSNYIFLDKIIFIVIFYCEHTGT